MADRDTGQEDHFDLLPFIAILMCVLGTELLVTMSMATISLGAGVGEGWIPAKDEKKATKNPLLIEWDGTTAVIQRATGDQHISVTFRGRAEVPELEGILNELAAKRETDYALFAVRPSGFENYYRLAAKFRERNITIGDEPLEQWKRVRLTRGKGLK